MSDMNEFDEALAAMITSAEERENQKEVEKSATPTKAVEYEQPFWVRFVVKCTPFLVRTCVFGRPHWRWSRICACGFTNREKPVDAGPWHGGLYDMDLDVELHPCSSCVPAYGILSHHWPLSSEEEVLVAAWRLYRHEALDHLKDDDDYHYAVNVEMNGQAETILTYSQGTAALGALVPWRKTKNDKPN